MSTDKNRVYIFDTTMRDGEQSPGASMSLEEKIQISRVFLPISQSLIIIAIAFYRFEKNWSIGLWRNRNPDSACN